MRNWLSDQRVDQGVGNFRWSIKALLGDTDYEHESAARQRCRSFAAVMGVRCGRHCALHCKAR